MGERCWSFAGLRYGTLKGERYLAGGSVKPRSVFQSIEIFETSPKQSKKGMVWPRLDLGYIQVVAAGEQTAQFLSIRQC